jgi:hypothetical protein
MVQSTFTKNNVHKYEYLLHRRTLGTIPRKTGHGVSTVSNCTSGDRRQQHVNSDWTSTCNVKVKVKFTLEQAMKAQRGSRGTAILFL